MADLSDYQLDQPLEYAHTLPARWYLDPAFYQLERDQIFSRHWHVVGHLGQLREPGDYFSCEWMGEPLLILKDPKGQIRAFSNVCRHRAGRLVDGSGRKAAIQCSYHGWVYNLEGSLQTAPEFEGVKNWEKQKVCLPEFPVEIWGPFVLVKLEGQRQLADTLEDIPQKIADSGFDISSYRFLYRRNYIVECNWKVYVDNYQEGYHIPIAHPSLAKQIDYRQYWVENHQNYSQHFSPIEMGSQNGDALWFLIYPHLMLNLYPENMTLNVVVPIDHTRTLTVFEWYVNPNSSLFEHPACEHVPDDDLSEELRKLISFSDLIQKEDMKLCEDVQKGLQSRTYNSGRLSVKRENGVYWFHQKLAQECREETRSH